MTDKKRETPAHLKGLPTTGGSYARIDASGKYRAEQSPKPVDTPVDAGEPTTDTAKRGKR